MNSDFIYKKTKKFSKTALYELFSSVNWDSSKDPIKLVKAFRLSTHVISAWDGKKLIGIIRCMDDNCWSGNIDCLVVHKEYQGQGISKELLKRILESLNKVKYINVCPNEKTIYKLYEQFDFKKIDGLYLQRIN